MCRSYVDICVLTFLCVRKWKRLEIRLFPITSGPKKNYVLLGKHENGDERGVFHLKKRLDYN